MIRNPDHLALRVDDLEATTARLEASGPEGITIELVERVEGR